MKEVSGQDSLGGLEAYRDKKNYINSEIRLELGLSGEEIETEERKKEGRRSQIRWNQCARSSLDGISLTDHSIQLKLKFMEPLTGYRVAWRGFLEHQIPATTFLPFVTF